MIKVLIIVNDTDGVGKYRMLDPHLCMDDPEIECEIRLLFDGTLNLIDERYISQFNIIFFNKALPFANKSYEETFQSYVKKYNIKLLYDLDDYWILNSTHLNYKNWKDSKSAEVTESYLRNVDAVVTTTELFAAKIREFNPNVYVLPNGVNLKEQQFVPKKEHINERIKFFWSGGISHRPDINLLKSSYESFDKDFREKAQIFMCGFDLRMRTPKGTFKSDPKTNEWTNFENIFSNNRKWIDNEYKEFLNKYDDKDFGWSDDFKDSFYQRVWTKPITIFGENLGMFDKTVSLAPLKNNHLFNYYKSNLKIVEAGAHSAPIIASNYGPYTIDNIEQNGFGFLIDESNKNGWYEKMKWFTENPSAVEDMGAKLHEYVKENYEISVICKKRAEAYKEIVNR